VRSNMNVHWLTSLWICRLNIRENSFTAVKITEIYEGTNEVRRMVVSGSLLR